MGGRGKHNFLIGGAFRKAKYEKLQRKKKRRKRGRAKIPSPPPPSFLPARAKKFFVLPREARQSEFTVRIFVKKSSDFNQQTPQIFEKGFRTKNMVGASRRPHFGFQFRFSILAETGGFEPPKGFKTLNSLARSRFQPLSHVSIFD